MRKNKLYTILALSLVATMTVKAQVTTTVKAQATTGETEDETWIVVEDKKRIATTVAADVVSQFIWRGQDLGDVSLQPTLGISYKGLSLTAWGSVGVSNSDDDKEIDLTIAYTHGGWNVGITDYWTTSGNDPDARYFRYNAHSTNYIFEANLGYDFGFASLQWYTNFAGNTGMNSDGKRVYSSYVEAEVPFRLTGVDWTAKAGIVPYATDAYDTDGFAITNLSLRATKSIQVTNTFTIPLFGELVANPCSQKAFLVFGFTLEP